MSRLYARNGRIEAPIDLALDPLRATRAGGFLRADTDRGRRRATTLPGVRVGLGDFGPLLYYSADDARIESGVMVVPNRTGLNADLRSVNTAPTIAAFMPGDAVFGASPSIVLVDGADTQLATPPLGALLAANMTGSFEVAIAVVLTGTPAAARLLFANFADIAGFTDGSSGATILDTREVEVTRQVSAGTDIRDSARLPIEKVRILHFVVRKTGAATGVVDCFINGVQSAGAGASASTGVPVWAGDQLVLGAELSGILLAPGIRIRDVAVYARELTRAERMAMFSGAFAVRDSIQEYPRLEHVLDLATGQYTTWHPDRAPVVAAGKVLEVDAFENDGTGATRATNARGRSYISPDGTSDIFTDTGAGFATSGSDALTFFCAFREDSAINRHFAISPYLATGDHLEVDTDSVQGDFSGAALTLAGLGSVAGDHVVAVGTTDGALFTLTGAKWGSGDPTYTKDAASAACGATPAATVLPTVGADVGGGAYVSGRIFGAGAFVGGPTASEIETLLQYFFQEHNT